MKTWKWLGAGIVGSVLITGCRHCGECDCECCWPVETHIEKKVETPQYSEGNVSIASVAHTLPPTVEVKKTPPPTHPKSIAYTVGAPDAGGSILGTVEITSEEADVMGVRPGYTPGALYLTPKSSLEPNVVQHADHAEQDGKTDEAVPTKGEQ
jgi:hypothetical protein